MRYKKTIARSHNDEFNSIFDSTYGLLMLLMQLDIPNTPFPTVGSNYKAHYEFDKKDAKSETKDFHK